MTNYLKCFIFILYQFKVNFCLVVVYWIVLTTVQAQTLCLLLGTSVYMGNVYPGNSFVNRAADLVFIIPKSLNLFH